MKKTVIMVIIMGLMLVISVLAFISLYIMTQEARISEHKIKRMRTYYAAKAGMVYAFSQLRQGGCGSGCSLQVGNGVNGYPSGGITVNISVGAGGGIPGTQQVNITATYP